MRPGGVEQTDRHAGQARVEHGRPVGEQTVLVAGHQPGTGGRGRTGDPGGEAQVGQAAAQPCDQGFASAEQPDTGFDLQQQATGPACGRRHRQQARGRCELQADRRRELQGPAGRLLQGIELEPGVAFTQQQIGQQGQRGGPLHARVHTLLLRQRARLQQPLIFADGQGTDRRESACGQGGVAGPSPQEHVERERREVDAQPDHGERGEGSCREAPRAGGSVVRPGASGPPPE